MNTTPVYYGTAEHARNAGELEQYRASAKANRECRDAIDKAIAEHFDGFHLRPEALTDVLMIHTPERIATVLAMTVKDRKYDGRLSLRNKAWAETVATPAEDKCYGYAYEALRSHATIINGYVDMFRSQDEKA